MIRFVIAAFCILAPATSWAHAFLDGAVPRVGSEIPAAPAEVVLHFSQEVEPDFSQIQVQKAAGASVTDGAQHSVPGDATRLAVKLQKVGAGIYTVTWHATSADTHKSQGKFHFTVTK